VPIRRIKPSDAAVLRTIRLRALLSDPGAFDSNYERESQLPTEEWERRATEASTSERQCLFVVDSPQGFVAMAGAYTPGDLTSVRRLYGMWVAPESRSAGLGHQLIEAITAWSISAGAEEVQLWVVDDNLRAQRLYARAGFQTTGVSQPLPSNPALTETLMHLNLRSPSSLDGTASGIEDHRSEPDLAR
jgi:ribosomal protein S18 acetylase RimI-like enzyme